MNLLKALGIKPKEEKATGELREEYAWEKARKKSRQIVSMIAEMENIEFDKLWSIFTSRTGNTVRFLMNEHAPIQCRYFPEHDEYSSWWVCINARNFEEALVMAKRAFEENPGNLQLW